MARKMTKAQMRKRLLEASSKIDKVFSNSLADLSGAERSKLFKMSMDIMSLRKKLK